MSKLNALNNETLLHMLIALYSKDQNYKEYYDTSNDKQLNKKSLEYARELQNEILSRMADNNAEQFKLYGVKDTSTGKLVSDITNPSHKYWESKKRAQSAIDGYHPSCITQRRRKIHNKDDLVVVEIKCIVQND